MSTLRERTRPGLGIIEPRLPSPAKAPPLRSGIIRTGQSHRFKRGPTLTLAQDFREARDWFSLHKRDPFLWLIILGPLTFFAINMWGLFVFPPSGAIRAINQVLPNSDEVNVLPKRLSEVQWANVFFWL